MQVLRVNSFKHTVKDHNVLMIMVMTVGFFKYQDWIYTELFLKTIALMWIRPCLGKVVRSSSEVCYSYWSKCYHGTLVQFKIYFSEI